MIQYRDRIGFITHEHKKGLDLFLLPNSMHPEAKLVTMVDPSEVTLAKIPNSMNEITGLDRKKIAVGDMLKRGHVVKMREGETRDEALTRGRAEIAESKLCGSHMRQADKAALDLVLGCGSDEGDDEPETDEVGRTEEDLKSVGD